MKKVLLCLILTLILSSCATTPASKVPEIFISNNVEGMIVGTISIEDRRPIFNQYFLHYNSEGDDDLSISRMITIRPEQIVKVKLHPDFRDGSKAVYLFAVKEIAGNYYFSMMRLHDNGGSLYQRTYKIPINIPFKIEPGKAKYFGEIYLDFKGEVLMVSNKKERDLKYFEQRFPGLKIIE
ncbi:MAG: hypothetical protein LBE34_11785 [Flavobacteriaceae bacterium]|jgi:hypothetical protein|nr:hypothetical protein [Flavobacteriaceae bacterium]